MTTQVPISVFQRGGGLNANQPSQPDLENGIIRQDDDMTTSRMHLRGGYDDFKVSKTRQKTEESEESKRVLAAPFEERIREIYGPSVVYAENGAGTVNLASLHRYILHSMQK